MGSNTVEGQQHACAADGQGCSNQGQDAVLCQPAQDTLSQPELSAAALGAWGREVGPCYAAVYLLGGKWAVGPRTRRQSNEQTRQRQDTAGQLKMLVYDFCVSGLNSLLRQPANAAPLVAWGLPFLGCRWSSGR